MSLHRKLIENEVVKPQLKKQVGWLDPDEAPPQSAWNKPLADMNCSFDLNERGDEGEDLEKLSHLLKRKVTKF